MREVRETEVCETDPKMRRRALSNRRPEPSTPTKQLTFKHGDMRVCGESPLKY